MKKHIPYSRIHRRAKITLIAGMLIAVFIAYLLLYIENAQPLVSPLASNNFSQKVYASEPYFDISLVKPYMIEVFGKVDGEKAYQMVTRCENKKLDPNAQNHNRNGSIDTGLFQINSIHGYREQDLKDWKFNVRAAYAIYKKAGMKFTPWSCAYIINQTPFYKGGK